MNDNAKKWVDALRSGEFEQGQNRLKTVHNNANYYCCLGVATELYNQEHHVYNQIKMSYDDNYYLQSKVKDWLGLSTHKGAYSKDDTDRSLADDNDNGCTFDEIAYIIESEPEGLFAE